MTVFTVEDAKQNREKVIDKAGGLSSLRVDIITNLNAS